MQRFGATPDQISRAVANTGGDCLVLPENWPALLWFLEVADLMRFSDFGRCLGLDWVQVQAEAALSARAIEPALFAKLRRLSQAAMHHFNQRRASQ
ncbi:hypothetical protein [Ferrimonas sp.]|uniref:hypothetical protein n=1 Tax=Ferrimonas sp. TaxID=2080861 RepID=UPI003A8FB381